MKNLRNTLLIVLLSVASFGSAQEVNTLFFLENAPMRHIVNPAFQPVSNGYVNFTPLGYMSFWAGNNSLTMSDVIYNYQGKTITALHPEGGDREKLYKAFRKAMLTNTDMTLNILGFGFRYKEKGYININIMERIDAGFALPRDMFAFMLLGGMKNLDGNNYYDLSQMGTHISAYTEISGGYSHVINEHWTVGGKLKFLLGQAYIGMRNTKIDVDASIEKWVVHGEGKVDIAAPLAALMPERVNWDGFEKMNLREATKNMKVTDYITPAGYGAAIDIGKIIFDVHPSDAERNRLSVKICKDLLADKKHLDPECVKYLEWLQKAYGQLGEQSEIDNIYNKSVFDPTEADNLDEHIQHLCDISGATVTEFTAYDVCDWNIISE